jgi:hypothetical protein
LPPPRHYALPRFIQAVVAAVKGVDYPGSSRKAPLTNRSLFSCHYA